MPLDELDTTALLQQEKDLQEDIVSAKDEVERSRYASRLTIVKAKLNAAK